MHARMRPRHLQGHLASSAQLAHPHHLLVRVLLVSVCSTISRTTLHHYTAELFTSYCLHCGGELLSGLPFINGEENYLVRALWASASARSANLLRMYCQTALDSRMVDFLDLLFVETRRRDEYIFSFNKKNL